MPTGLWMSPQGWRWKQTPSDGDEIVDCFCSLQCSSERLRIQGNSAPTWRTIPESQCTSRRSVRVRQAAGFWTASDQRESSWTTQGMIPYLLLPASDSMSGTETVGGGEGVLETSSVSLRESRDGFHCDITPILLISRQYRVPAHLARASAGGRRQSRSSESTDRRRPCFMAAVAPTQRRIPCNLGLGALQGRRTNAVYYFYTPCV